MSQSYLQINLAIEACHGESCRSRVRSRKYNAEDTKELVNHARGFMTEGKNGTDSVVFDSQFHVSNRDR
jgi:hypothetical protein